MRFNKRNFNNKKDKLKSAEGMTVIVRNNDVIDTIELSHTYNKNQIDWFKAGSSLNLIAQNISNE